jgi:hypothetical protein
MVSLLKINHQNRHERTLVYMLEAGSLIIMVNGEYTTTVKGIRLLMESQ